MVFTYINLSQRFKQIWSQIFSLLKRTTVWVFCYLLSVLFVYLIIFLAYNVYIYDPLGFVREFGSIFFLIYYYYYWGFSNSSAL